MRLFCRSYQSDNFPLCSSTQIISNQEQSAPKTKAAVPRQDATKELAPAPSLKPEDVTIAFICALPRELDAMIRVLDSKVDFFPQADEDIHIFLGGTLAGRQVVLVLLSNVGGTDATVAGERLALKFPNLQLTLLVGICAGVPTPENDIRLGDVIISSWVERYASDARMDPNGFKTSDNSYIRTDVQPKLKEILHLLESEEVFDGFLGKSSQNLVDLQHRNSSYTYPNAPDLLFPLSYAHVHRSEAGNRQSCGCDPARGAQCDAVKELSCDSLGCQKACATLRERQEFDIFTGGIGSEDIIMRGNASRDELGKRGIMGVDTEAFGMIHLKGALVIKAAVDYGDSHKNKEWQDYAAGVAACVAKAFISDFYPLALTEGGHGPDGPVPEGETEGPGPRARWRRARHVIAIALCTR